VVVVLALTAVALLLSVWIVVPTWTPLALVAAVVAIEWSPYLFVLNVVLLLAALRTPDNAYRPLAITLAVVAACLTAWPSVALCVLQARSARSAVAALIHPSRTASVREFEMRMTADGPLAPIRAYLPAGASPPPIVFSLYGGAWRHGTPGKDAGLDRALARHGYAVFALDYRHAPAFRFPQALHDIEAQMSFVVKKASSLGIDAARVAIIGHSSGGQLGLLAAYASGSQVRAVVSYSGPIDLARSYRDPPRPDPLDVRSILRDYLGGSPDEGAGLYAAASPISDVRGGLPATLLIYGARDHIVDVRGARALRSALLAQHDSVEYCELPWADHAFEEVPFGLHSLVAFDALEDFLAKTLRKQ